MARGTRIDYQDAWHHVMHRGARRAPTFFDVFTNPMKTWGEVLGACLYDK
jgi:hypothetical protein